MTGQVRLSGRRHCPEVYVLAIEENVYRTRPLHYYWKTSSWLPSYCGLNRLDEARDADTAVIQNRTMTQVGHRMRYTVEKPLGRLVVPINTYTVQARIRIRCSIYAFQRSHTLSVLCGGALKCIVSAIEALRQKGVQTTIPSIVEMILTYRCPTFNLHFCPISPY
jgi:hypothetical protein